MLTIDEVKKKYPGVITTVGHEGDGKVTVSQHGDMPPLGTKEFQEWVKKVQNHKDQPAKKEPPPQPTPE